MIVCAPTASEYSGPLAAAPSASDTGAPRFEPSIWNWIVPVGVGPPLRGMTMTPKVISSPGRDGLADEPRATWATGWGETVSVPLPLLAS